MIYNDIKEMSKFADMIAKMKKRTEHAADSVKNSILKVVAEGANDIRNDIISSMATTPRQANFYLRGKSKRVRDAGTGKMRRARHFPSMPFNPPAIDSGQLVRSIMWKADGNKVEVGVIGGTKAMGKDGKSYAIHLEFGTKFMEKRPFLKPAVDAHIQDIKRKVEEKTRNELTIIGEEGNK